MSFRSLSVRIFTRSFVEKWLRIMLFLNLPLVLIACGATSSGDKSPSQDPVAGNGNNPKHFKTAIYVTSSDTVPTCNADLATQLAYIQAESKFKFCNGSAWQEVSINGADKTPTSPPATTPILVSAAMESAGANCFYGGTKYNLGSDVNSNSVLEQTEISGAFYSCESSINNNARALFDKYVYSVGLVSTTYRYTGTCYGEYDIHELAGSGTAWAYSTDTFVTNAHLLDKTTSADCDDDGTSETTFTLSEVKILLPKTSIPVEIWRSRGPSYGPTSYFETDYDVFYVNNLDRRPSLAASPALPTDIADAVFMRVLGHGRVALPISNQTQDQPNANSVRIGEQLALIGHPEGRSSSLSIGSLMSMQTCYEWWNTSSNILALILSSSNYCKLFYNVTDSRRMIVSNYMEHGSSGGPALNRFGEVVGILTWGSISDEQSDFGALQQIAYLRPWLLMQRVWTGLID